VKKTKVEIRCPNCGTIDDEIDYEIEDWTVSRCEYCGAKTCIVPRRDRKDKEKEEQNASSIP